MGKSIYWEYAVQCPKERKLILAISCIECELGERYAHTSCTICQFDNHEHKPYVVFHTDNYTDEVTSYHRCKICGILVNRDGSVYDSSKQTMTGEKDV